MKQLMTDITIIFITQMKKWSSFLYYSSQGNWLEFSSIFQIKLQKDTKWLIIQVYSTLHHHNIYEKIGISMNNESYLWIRNPFEWKQSVKVHHEIYLRNWTLNLTEDQNCLILYLIMNNEQDLKLNEAFLEE